MAIRILIAESDTSLASEVARFLSNSEMDVVGIAATSEDALEMFVNDSPDVVLIGIRLQGKRHSTDVVKSFKRIRNTPIIYLSGPEDRATTLRAKETKPANFIFTPINETSLVTSIEFAFNTQKSIEGQTAGALNDDHIYIRTSPQVFEHIETDSILFLEAHRAYCKIRTFDKTYMISTSMNHVHAQLGKTHFHKVNRSFVVNINKIGMVNNNIITIVSNHKISISREFKTEVMAHLRIIR